MKSPHRSTTRGSFASALALLLSIITTTTTAGPGAHGPDGEHLDTAASSTSASALQRLPDGSVYLPKPSQRRLGVRTLLATQAQTALSVELPGRVLADPNASGRVEATFSGVIETPPQGLPVAGQAVQRDAVLALLRPLLDPVSKADLQGRITDLQARRQLAQQRLQRLLSLQGTVAAKDIASARTELESLQAQESSLRQSQSEAAALRAPISGVIAQSHARPGQVVQLQDLLFDIIDPARLMIEASSADAALLDDIEAASLAGHAAVKLTLLGASRVFYQGLLPLNFAVSANGSALPLAVGQTVRVIVQRKTRLQGIAVPQQALTRNANNEPVVWIKTSAERFVAQPVQYLPLDATNIVITAGLAPDNRVVVEGADLIAQIR